MSIAKHIPDNIKLVSKSVGFALWVDGADEWIGLSAILMAHLSPAERAAMAYAALNSLDEDTAYLTASVALYGTLQGEAVA